MMSAPAFTAVAARQSFNRDASAYQAPNTHNNPPPSSSPKTVEWPQAVRNYVQRAFAEENAIPGIDSTAMSIKLKSVITDAAKRNALYSIDWPTYALPQQMLLAERAALYVSSSTTPTTTAFPASFSYSQPVSANSPTTENTRKRKSPMSEESDSHAATIPPWRRNELRNSFESRLTFVDGNAKKNLDQMSKSNFNAENDRRKQRFQLESQKIKNPWKMDEDEPENTGPVIGRSQDLEKRYFRLTAAPNPDTVRPLHILRKSLDLIKKKWRDEYNYNYVCDQLKSLRQDLTVQHIKNEFTVDVYEIHARIALEKGDLGEYNQCQTQLRALYPQNLGGHPSEFMAYRILYLIHAQNRSDLNDVLAELTPSDKLKPEIKHALAARSALALGNYHKFFKLYLETPNMGAYLMDMFVARERLAALSNMCRGYKPDLKLRFVTEELGFESDEEAAQFICEHGGQAFLEEKDGEVKLLTGKVGNVIETARATAFKKVDIKGQM